MTEVDTLVDGLAASDVEYTAALGKAAQSSAEAVTRAQMEAADALSVRTKADRQNGQWIAARIDGREPGRRPGAHGSNQRPYRSRYRRRPRPPRQRDFGDVIGVVVVQHHWSRPSQTLPTKTARSKLAAASASWPAKSFAASGPLVEETTRLSHNFH